MVSDVRADGRLVVCLRTIVLAAAGLALFNILYGQALSIDEIEFYRASDLVRSGLIPYRDFWEHHVPLQWFLFAPATALTRSPGAIAVILMRVVQLPLWIATFACLMDIMRRAGSSARMRWLGVTLLVTSWPFVVHATEFRIDALSSFLMIAAIDVALRSERSPLLASACGSLLCLAGLANLRVMPLSLAIGALLFVMSPVQARWTVSRRGFLIAGGGLLVTAGAIVWLVATGSVAQAWRYAVMDNILTDSSVGRMYMRTARLLLNVVGFNTRGDSLLARLPIPDFPAMVLWSSGLVGAVMALRRWRRPDLLFFIAAIAITSVVMTCRVNLAYYYHFGLPQLLLVPLAVSAVARIPSFNATPRLLCAFAVIVLLVASMRTLFFANDGDLRYQDMLMRAVHQRTAPSDVVLDPVGWALRRRPAYRYWFVPALVRVLILQHRMQPYLLHDAIRTPPAAVFVDGRTVNWLLMDPALTDFITRHYAPVWPNLWLPVPNGIVTPGGQMAWFVPRDGQYEIHASPLLAKHPWFRAPFAFLRGDLDDLRIDLKDFPARALAGLHWRLDGQDVPSNAAVVSLRKGQRLAVSSSASEPIGVFLTMRDERALFRSNGGADIDGYSDRYFHVPSLGRSR